MFANYICSQSATFPAGSLSTNTQVLPSVGITTEEYWLTDATQGCFTFTAVPQTPTAPTPPTPSPVTNSPVSRFPTESPTEQKLPTQSPAKEIATPTTSMPLLEPIAGPVGPRSAPPTTSESSSSNAGAIAGGIVAGVAVLAIVAFLFLRKNGPSENVHKPPVSGVVASASESNTVANTAFRETLPAPGTVVASPYTTPTNSLATEVTGAQPVHPSPIHTSNSATPMSPGDAYDVRFKDQARSVIGPSQSSGPMVVSGVPMAEAIPIAVALDSSAASGASKNSLKSEPPGRRMEEP
jgi:hypothetical protein